MPKTIDVLIGLTTILTLFSLGVTLFTETINLVLQHRARQLRSGLADLLQHLGISQRELAIEIAQAVLAHPLVASSSSKLGSVIHREEFTHLLLDLATGSSSLKSGALAALREALAHNGIADPQATLSNVWMLGLQIETANPGLATHARQALAMLEEARTPFVARIHGWFDQTIDRVNHRFASRTRWITILVAALVSIGAQIDIVAVTNRLYLDDQARAAIARPAELSQLNAPASGISAHWVVENAAVIESLQLLTVPTDGLWLSHARNPRIWPGVALSTLLLSLGAPFWYNVLKDLLGFRSQLARNDRSQRMQRQGDLQRTDGDQSGMAGLPAVFSGERGDLTAVG